jgi:hypothetical protein
VEVRRCRVVLSVSAAVASSSAALGELLPQPRWSNRMTQYRCRSKNRVAERIYWEEYGTITGEPVMVMHGGPGAGSHSCSAAQKEAAQDQSLHGCGVCDGRGQREGAAPAAAKDVPDRQCFGPAA